jgi:hypothetical protein
MGVLAIRIFAFSMRRGWPTPKLCRKAADVSHWRVR